MHRTTSSRRVQRVPVLHALSNAIFLGNEENTFSRNIIIRICRPSTAFCYFLVCRVLCYRITAYGPGWNHLASSYSTRATSAFGNVIFLGNEESILSGNGATICLTINCILLFLGVHDIMLRNYGIRNGIKLPRLLVCNKCQLCSVIYSIIFLGMNKTHSQILWNCWAGDVKSAATD